MSASYPSLARCEMQHMMVRTDLPQRQCALEHGCPAGHACPLDCYFAEAYEAYRQPGAWERSGGTCI